MYQKYQSTPLVCTLSFVIKKLKKSSFVSSLKNTNFETSVEHDYPNGVHRINIWNLL